MKKKRMNYEKLSLEDFLSRAEIESKKYDYSELKKEKRKKLST